MTAPYDFCDGGGYRAIIKRALRNRGYASVTGGRIYAARIAEAVNAFYGGNFESVDSNEIYGVASNSRTVSVRKILQLACFLNLSLSDLLAPPSEDNTLAECISRASVCTISPNCTAQTARRLLTGSSLKCNLTVSAVRLAVLPE